MGDSESPISCTCAVCGDPQRCALPADRRTRQRHAARAALLLSPNKRVREHTPSDEDKAEEAPVIDSSDEEVMDAHAPARPRSGPERLRQFSKEILEFIGANDVNQTHVIKILRTVRAHFGPCSETGIVCPVTLYNLKKHAGYSASKGTVLLRLCAKDHPNPSDSTTCATCALSLEQRWPRRMVHIDIVDRLSRLMSVPAVAQAFLYAHDREPGDGDMWDGAHGRSISLQRRRDVFFLGLSSDATEFGHTKSASLTPFVALVLNFPPSMRSTFSAIMLMAVFPEKARTVCLRTCVYVRVVVCARMCVCAHARAQITSYSNLVTFVLKHLQPFMEGGIGFIVFDAHLGAARRMWISLTWLLEDTRGIPHPTGSKQAPAYVGGCAFCEVRGIRHGQTSVYMSAIAHTRTASIKARFGLEHAGSPDLLEMAAAPPPARMTTAKAVASVQRVIGGAVAAEEPYKSLSPYHVILGSEWDFLRYSIIYDIYSMNHRNISM